MKSHEKRFKVPQLAPEISVAGEEVQHMRVLRLKAGDEIQVFDGSGKEAVAKISSISAFTAELVVSEPFANPYEPNIHIHLALALLKGDKLADVVRAVTELGVYRIQLLKTAFGDVPDLGENKLYRLRRIAEEACKQCRRGIIPEIAAPIHLKALPEVKQGYVAHPYQAGFLHDTLNLTGEIWLATGPEGGFREDEIVMLHNKGYKSITLGKRIVRAETAPVALLGAMGVCGI